MEITNPEITNPEIAADTEEAEEGVRNAPVEHVSEWVLNTRKVQDAIAPIIAEWRKDCAIFGSTTADAWKLTFTGRPEGGAEKIVSTQIERIHDHDADQVAKVRAQIDRLEPKDYIKPGDADQRKRPQRKES